MAAQKTAIADIYEPAIWSKYLLELNTSQNKLIQSGIMGTSPEIDDAANQGGRTVDMPFWDDLPHNTGTTTKSKVVTDTDDEIVPAGITSDKDIAVKHFRAQSFQVSPIVKYVAGSDPAQVVIQRFANWWMREEQRLLILILKGIFSDSTIASEHQNNIAGETATTDASKLIGSDAVLDTQFLLGDAYSKFTGMIMHSTPFKRLVKLDLIDNIRESQQDPTIMPTYMGKTLLVDDDMTVVAGSTSGYKYHTYLFGQGAIARTDIPLQSGDPNLELFRNPLAGTGAGMLDIITRRYFLLHPRGIKYTGSLSGVVSPSDSDLEADNYTRVYLKKNIRVARLITNG